MVHKILIQEGHLKKVDYYYEPTEQGAKYMRRVKQGTNNKYRFLQQYYVSLINNYCKNKLKIAAQ